MTKKFQKEIYYQSKQLDKLLNECAIKTQNISDTVNYFKNLNHIIEKYNDLNLFIFYFDSLIYWSDNSIHSEELIDEQNFIREAGFLSNGHYLFKSNQKEGFKIIVTYLVKSQYQYQNQYLKSEFPSSKCLPDVVEINYDENGYEILNEGGEYLFSLIYPVKPVPGKKMQFIFIFLFLLSYIFIHAFLYCIYKHILLVYNLKWSLVFVFVLDVFIVRALVFYFRYPEHIYSTQLFSPEYFASTTYLPSLGDLLLNSISLISIAIAFFKFKWEKTFYGSKTELKKLLITVITLFVILAIFEGLIYLVKTLVINSSINFNLNYISNINEFSFIAFACISLLISSFIFASLKPMINIIDFYKSFSKYSIIVFIFLVAAATVHFCLIDNDLYNYIFLFVFLLSVWNLKKLNTQYDQISFSFSIIQILLFAAFTTYLLFVLNNHKEKENRIIYAQTLSEQQDPFLEYKISLIRENIFSNPEIINRLKPDSIDADIKNYINEIYFNDGFEDYDKYITICDSKFFLDVQPDDINVNCFEYFESLVNDYGNTTSVNNLFIIDYIYITGNYLAVFDFTPYNINVKIFVELYSKNIPRGLGYPELLIDSRNSDRSIWKEYAFAFYKNGELIYRNGNYFYPMEIAFQSEESSKDNFRSIDNYSHLFYKVNEQFTVVISNKNPNFLDIVSPFSYISIFFGLFTVFLLSFLKTPYKFNIREINLKKRLQFSIVALIFASFIFIGISSVYYIISLNKDKNESILSEKAHSVLIELEHKLAEEPVLTADMELYLSDLLYKFSLVFFTDINLYSPEGTLLASSRSEIFNKRLLSNKMDPKAFQNLNYKKASLFIHEEKIAEYPFLSAYLPFINVNNNLIGYINLPYFAKQEELTKEISDFLVAFINIYVILIAVAIYIALIISNYITKPLQLLREKISQLKLGKSEEKIAWSKNDEIGSLVVEYNRMVDELASSVQLLAKSERESAWREMAKQIAHEIKNPLTPMKLSVQYLQKAWDEKSPDWDDRLKRFTRTIVEQINSLSIIATEFSDFAKMPRSNFAEVNLIEVISNAIDLYKDISPNIEFEFRQTNSCMIFGDKEQLLRVFNNLIKNSLQAIGNNDNGLISIKIVSDDKVHLISFTDSGKGIPDDQKAKVFSPNFTTKSGGMGLGLAMVKNIITNSSGKISFESKEGKGTTFTIEFPRFDG
ncbi:MAG: HAMP domain-containing histidine kinase [Bacteroidales bacterium]|nr:HAMP domain-containing histidine kinase [Bacteroidales bacterium]MCF8403481.1 HAMP domain-containing histidine kinase [Bacteroidales bacterium]